MQNVNELEELVIIDDHILFPNAADESVVIGAMRANESIISIKTDDGYESQWEDRQTKPFSTEVNQPISVKLIYICG